MLLTRCPDCDTTFRVTDEALKKAHGQVRCGRCASVFNAYAELREPPSDAASPQSVPPRPEGVAGTPHETPRAPETATPNAPETSPSNTPPRSAAPAPGTVLPGAVLPGGEPPAGASRFDVFTVADVVAQVGLLADEDAETGELQPDAAALASADSMSAEQVHQVLDDGPESTPAPWPLAARASRSRWWGVAVCAAIAALGAQTVHHFRADLVRHAIVGPIVQDAYAMLGTRVVPRWNVHEYQILDWIATAEPNVRGQGSLKITARIQNRARQSQPYPSVQVQLKDRWEAAVGRRVFAPAEYGARAKELMAPGETARAEIEVVDPGPDAYGFELDVCIEVETDLISCGADKVFL